MATVLEIQSVFFRSGKEDMSFQTLHGWISIPMDLNEWQNGLICKKLQVINDKQEYEHNLYFLHFENSIWIKKIKMKQYSRNGLKN